jgi:hypothetical protein
LQPGTRRSIRPRGSRIARGCASINEKIRASLKGRKGNNPRIWTEEDYRLSKEAMSRLRIERCMNLPWEDVVKSRRRVRERILIEQNGICAICGIGQKWNGKPLSFHLDHIHGRLAGEGRDNLRMICPNCHAQTPGYGRPATPAGRERQREGGRRGLRIAKENRARVAERETQPLEGRPTSVMEVRLLSRAPKVDRAPV